MKHIFIIIILAGFFAACDRLERPDRKSFAGAEAFCKTLQEMRYAENKFSDVSNELYGHTENLRRLYEVAPEEIAASLP